MTNEAMAAGPIVSPPPRILEDHAALKTKVPDDFWWDLRKDGVVAGNAPLPIDK